MAIAIFFYDIILIVVIIMLDVISEILLEAKNGKVIVDGDEWPLCFNTIIYGVDGKTKNFYYNERSMATLVIRNEKLFEELMADYILACIQGERKHFKLVNDTYENRYKLFMAFLFTNFSTEDFLNPEQAIRRHIEYIQDDTFSYLDDGYDFIIGDKLNGSSLNVKRSDQAVGMETPYKLSFSLVKADEYGKCSCSLAEISYGIVLEDNERVCYVYSVIKPKEWKKEVSSQDAAFRKKINRILYKLNDGLYESELDDLNAFRNGESDYYPEGNITDVTHSFVLALTSFVTLLQKEGIGKIKVVPYLPVRYSSRYNAAMDIEENEELREELLKRNNNIQNNATNKFLRTFRRVAYHLNGSMKMVSVPYEYDEYMTFTLSEQLQIVNNPILEDVSLGILGDENVKSL